MNQALSNNIHKVTTVAVVARHEGKYLLLTSLPSTISRIQVD